MGVNDLKKKFQKLQKLPLDIYEIHIGCEFGHILMKIAASSLSDVDKNEQRRTFQYPC